MAVLPQQGALPPPPGVPPNLGHAESPLKVTWLVSLALILVFPAITVPLRIYIKVAIVKSFKITDAACLVGYANFIALIALGFAFVNVGMGKHAWDLPMSSYARLAELLNIQQAVYMPAILFTKVAILLQLLEIFVPPRLTNNTRRYSLYILMALNTTFFTMLMFLEIFQCKPRRKIWNPTIPGRCININQTFVATGVINVIDDFIILIIPLVWTWRLRLRMKQKIGVSLIFATGFFACLTSVMRLAESIKSLNNPDISVSLVPVSLWAVAEVSAGLVVCCLPVMPRLFKHKNVRTRLQPSDPSGHATRLVDKNLPTISSQGDINGGYHSDVSLSQNHPMKKESYNLKRVSLEQGSETARFH
ncbi:hypothetical protein GQ44DRAFT_776048 [Phaeosphaeriaceae sp. PMI808]|nr:hypothetical protein GQ44DRAFT_776048 [Phaeosphaeriaceae sp. PMI808]